MKSMILYSTVVGGFYAQTDHLAAAVASARARVGEETWKRGFSGRDPGGATDVAHRELREAVIDPVRVEGELAHVGFVENRDNAGNTYPKLRVGLQCMDEEMLLSLDLKGDVAQKLLVKLDNCQPGDYVRISAWPTVVNRGDRSFINHAVSVKGLEAAEVPSNSSFSAEVKQKMNFVGSSLVAAGVIEKKIQTAAKVTKRVEAHKELLLKLAERFGQVKNNV